MSSLPPAQMPGAWSSLKQSCLGGGWAESGWAQHGVWESCLT